MKKFGKIVLALALVASIFAFVACGAASFIPGSTWEINDLGSLLVDSRTWTFETDGSITVTTVSGNTTNTSKSSYTYSVSGNSIFLKSGDTTTEYTVVKTASSDGSYTMEFKNSNGSTAYSFHK